MFHFVWTIYVSTLHNRCARPLPSIGSCGNELSVYFNSKSVQWNVQNFWQLTTWGLNRNFFNSKLYCTFGFSMIIIHSFNYNFIELSFFYIELSLFRTVLLVQGHCEILNLKREKPCRLSWNMSHGPRYFLLAQTATKQTGRGHASRITHTRYVVNKL